ncbi:hypothetical protein B0H15DRAFT_1022666 [Mycena belliarum]|uniref:Uncharacterized protein n=1 Tax=Mycena belliarum TaxID=1033014 RepID=A0AAD6XLR2_9AGAR|nr:hypothetical protein B0H15DRAFT_1022666 [Mycena belliae]
MSETWFADAYHTWTRERLQWGDILILHATCLAGSAPSLLMLFAVTIRDQVTAPRVA